MRIRIPDRILQRVCFIAWVAIPWIFISLPDRFFQREESVGCFYRWLHAKDYFHFSWLEQIVSVLNPAPLIFPWVEAGECFGCGLTRAMRCLSRFDWQGALEYHPWSPFIAIALLIGYGMGIRHFSDVFKEI